MSDAEEVLGVEYECVYCGEPIQSPHEHHRREHPDRRYDPVWYHEVNTVGGEEGS